MNSVVELAATVIGSFTLPSTEKALSEVFRFETTTEDELEFTRVTLEFPELPTFTEPKSMEFGTALNVPSVGVPVVGILFFRSLPHPTSAVRSAKLSNAPMPPRNLPREDENRSEKEETREDAPRERTSPGIVNLSQKNFVTRDSNFNF